MSDKAKPSLNLKDLQEEVVGILQQVRRYAVVIFLVFVAILYGFILMRVNNLSNAQPSSDAVSSQVKAAQIPHIDPSVVNQIESLQNNSVNVQSLFNQERSNPFQ
jgi:hypothetical protein